MPALGMMSSPHTVHAKALGRGTSAFASNQARPSFRVIQRSATTSVTRPVPGSRFTICPRPVRGRPFSGNADRPGAGGARRAVVVWFRSDLRVDDHEPLAEAQRSGSSVLPVYCFDPRDYGQSPAGFDKTGAYRARFLLDSVAELRMRLKERGSDLLIRLGKPEEVLPELARKVRASAVHCHCEVTYEEGQVEEKVRAALQAAGDEGSSGGGGSISLRSYWGSTLHHPEDLPFAMERMPTTYGSFREQMADVRVRPPVDPPSRFKAWPANCSSLQPGELPSLQQLGVSEHAIRTAQDDVHAKASTMRGGEREAERRLEAFIGEWIAAPQATATAAASTTSKRSGAAQQRGEYGAHFSCKVSPWLAMGCLSPRRLYHELSKRAGPAAAAAQQQPVAAKAGASSSSNQTTNRVQWLQFELLWRDFFRFITRRYSTISLGHIKAGQGAAAGPQPSATAVALV